MEDAAGFCIISDPNSAFIEAWSPWHLPFMNLTHIQRRYRAELRDAIVRLATTGGVYATYVSDRVTRNLDTENVLFYNLGVAPFRGVATHMLRFNRICAPVPGAPRSLSFEPRHYVRYRTETLDNAFADIQGEKLAACPPVTFRNVGEIRDKAKLPRLWRSFKRAVVKTANAAWSPGDLFAIQLSISAPASCALNLAHIVKPLLDGFVSAFHHYEGSQLVS